VDFWGIYDGQQLYTLVPQFINKLNTILKRIPSGRGRPHLLQIYRNDRVKWFIASKSSPRFMWSRKLTHREVGQNLDFFAAGHVIEDKHDHLETRSFSIFVELGNHVHTEVVVECVLINYIPNFAAFRDFSLRKERLFNSVMERLLLPYRFKWFYYS